MKSANIDAVKALPGVHDAFIVKASEANPSGDPQGVSDGVAIVAKSWWAASKAREKLEIAWDEGPTATQSSERLRGRRSRLGAGVHRQPICGATATSTSALQAAARMSSRRPIPIRSLPTSALEPQNCTAHFEDGKVVLWAPTQNPGPGAKLVAATLGHPREQT